MLGVGDDGTPSGHAYPDEVRVLVDIDIMREEGEGIPRIFEEMEESFLDRYRLAVDQKRVLLANPDGFSNEAYRKLTGVDRDQAYREIQELVTLGIIDGAPSSGRGAVYRISSVLKQQRTWLESRLPKICDFLAHNESLTNQDYCRIFSVTRYVAVRELKKVVDAGFLISVGSYKTARYLPADSMKIHMN